MKARTSGDAYVGDRIREARFTAKLTQAELGRKLGVSFQQIQKFEKGMSRVGGGQMVLLAKALNKPLPFFFPGAPGPRASAEPGVDHFVASKEGFRLARDFLRISPRARELVLDLVAHLVREQA